jgi:hypothetical protein
VLNASIGNKSVLNASIGNKSVLNASIGVLKTFYLNGKGYTLNKNAKHNSFTITHNNSNSFVRISYKHRGKLVLLEGYTHRDYRNRGIGTKLRAFATIFSKFMGVPIKHTGFWFIPKRPNNKNNRPPTTRIVRNKLGWASSIGNKSVFNPMYQSINKAKNVLAK